MAEFFQPKFVDLVRSYTTTTGTDDFVLGSAVSGFSGFTEGCAVGDRFYYAAVGVDNPAEREVGRGTLLDGGVIAREPVSGTKTDFSNGTKSIALVAASEWFSEVSAVRAADGPTSVKSFGAMGDSDESGSTGTDDTAAIQAALDHVDSIGGGTVYFPEGCYRITSCLTVHPKTLIRGAGKGGVVDRRHARRRDRCDAGRGIGGRFRLAHFVAAQFVEQHLRYDRGHRRHEPEPKQRWRRLLRHLRHQHHRSKRSPAGIQYGVVLEQSELVDIELCDIGAQNDDADRHYS